MASVKSFETDMKKVRRKRKNKRILKNTLFILVIVAISLVIYFTRSLWLSYFDGILEDAQLGMRDETDGELQTGNYPFDVSKKSELNIGSMNKCWTLLADSEFYVYNLSGNVIYTQQVNYSNPVINESEKRTLIYDLGGYSFMTLSNKKQMYSKRLIDQILLGEVGENGAVAIVTSNDKYTSYLTVYDKNGSEIYHWADGNMITAVDINDKGTGCAVSSTYAKGGQYHSVISVIDFSSDEPVTKSDTLPAMTFALERCSDGQLWVVTDNCLYRLSQDGKINFSFDYTANRMLRLEKFDVGSNICYLVFENTNSKKSDALLFSYASDTVKAYSDIDKVTTVEVIDNLVYQCSKTALRVFDSNDRVYLEAPLESECKQLSVSGENIYTMSHKLIDRIEISLDDSGEE